MNWMHPWLLAGLAAATLPVLIHLIGRRRARVIPFAAFDFLLAVNKRIARREKIRQFLLLLFRTLAIAALVMGLARPMPPNQGVAKGALKRWVLILDASASMAYEQGGDSLLQRAKDAAKDFVAGLEPGEPVVLVIADDELSAPFQTPTLERSAILRAIGGIEKPSGSADMAGAIDMGLGLLGEKSDGAQLVIFSDLSRNAFGGLQPLGVDPLPSLRLVDVAARKPEGAALPNLAIEAVSQRVGINQQERRFEITVRNYSSQAITGAVVELRMGGVIKQRGYVDVQARDSLTKTLTYSFSDPGVYPAQIYLSQGGGDGFATDDRFAFVVHVQPAMKVLLVNGDPRTTPYEDELFFIERALQATPQGQEPIGVEIVTAAEFANEMPPEKLKDYRAVVFAQVMALSESSLGKVREFVDAGGGVLYTLGPKIKFETYNQSLRPLLPHPLRDLHRVFNERDGTPPVGLGEFDWGHPILRGLQGEAHASLQASRTRAYFNLAQGSKAAVRTLIRFDNGAPALVERRMGDGRVMMLTTSIDADLSDLVLRSAFVPFIQRTLRYLGGDGLEVAAAPIRQGESLRLPLPTGAQGIALTFPKPDAQRRIYQGAQIQDGVLILDAVETVGVYEAEVRYGDDWRDAPGLTVVVNPSLEESDFLPVTQAQVRDAMAGEGESAPGVLLSASVGADPFASRGYAPYFLLALILLFIAESALAARG